MSTKEKNITLKDVKLFEKLTSADLQTVEGFLSEHFFDRGETLFVEKNDCDRILIVRSGNVKLYRLSDSGKEQILDVLKPGETCVCNPGSTEWQCAVSAQAMTPTNVWVLMKKHYVQLVKLYPSIAHSLNQIFADRLCRFCSLVEQVSITDSRKRLIKFILDNTDEMDPKYKEINYLSIKYTHEEIAQHLGIVRETVTRLIKQLKDEHLIETKPRQIIIPDKDQLQSALL